MEAANDKDIDKFQQTLHARNEVSPFDPWHTTLLLKVKNLIEPDKIDFMIWQRMIIMLELVLPRWMILRKQVLI